MTLELVAQGGVGSLFGLGQYEGQYQEGDRGVLLIEMSLIPPGLKSGLTLALENTPGFNLTHPVDSLPGRIIRIRYKKGLAPLALLVLALGIFFVGAILLLVTAWALFRDVIADIAPNIPLLAILGVGALGLIVWTQRKRTT